MTNLDSVLKSRDVTLLTRVHIRLWSPSGHVRLWELDCSEGRGPKNSWLQTVVLDKTPESLLDSKEIKLVHLRGDQPWIFPERTEAEAEALVSWSSDGNRRLIGKVSDARKDRGQKEKGASEDEMAGWPHWCNGHRLGQTPGAGEGQGGLECYSPWGHKESDTTERLNNNHQSGSRKCVEKLI